MILRSGIARRCRTLALVFSLPLTGLACAHSNDQADSRGSTVTILYQGDERVVGWHGRFVMFLPLVSFNESGKVEGRLAERWEHSPDYREWTLHLRTDVRWHDGVPFTAHDIKFSMELHEFYYPPTLFEAITVLDDSTLTIRYTRPSAPKMMGGWADSLAIVGPQPVVV